MLNIQRTATLRGMQALRRRVMPFFRDDGKHEEQPKSAYATLASDFDSYARDVAGLAEAVASAHAAAEALARALANVASHAAPLAKLHAGLGTEAAAYQTAADGLENAVLRSATNAMTTAVLGPMRRIVAMNSEIRGRIDERAAAQRDYEAATKEFASLQRARLRGAGGSTTHAVLGLIGLSAHPPADPAARAALDAARHAEKQVKVVARLSTSQATAVALTEALTDELTSLSTRRREVTARLFLSVVGVHYHMLMGAAAAFVPCATAAALALSVGTGSTQTLQTDRTSNPPMTLKLHTDALDRLSATTVQGPPWWDEGAAARNKARAAAEQRRAAARQAAESAVLRRDVPLPYDPPTSDGRGAARRTRMRIALVGSDSGLRTDGAVDVPAETQLCGARLPAHREAAAIVLASPAWLARIGRYLTVGDLAHMSAACAAWADIISGEDGRRVWLECVRHGGVRASHGALDEPSRARTDARVRVRFWAHALGADGRPPPPWSLAAATSAPVIRTIPSPAQNGNTIIATAKEAPTSNRIGGAAVNTWTPPTGAAVLSSLTTFIGSLQLPEGTRGTLGRKSGKPADIAQGTATLQQQKQTLAPSQVAVVVDALVPVSGPEPVGQPNAAAVTIPSVLVVDDATQGGLRNSPLEADDSHHGVTIAASGAPSSTPSALEPAAGMQTGVPTNAPQQENAIPAETRRLLDEDQNQRSPPLVRRRPGAATSLLRPISRDDFTALLALARAESAAGAKVEATADGDMSYDAIAVGSLPPPAGDDSSRLHDAQPSACRWAALIEQDVLRSYAAGVKYGDSSAVQRQRLRLAALSSSDEDISTGAANDEIDAQSNKRPTRLLRRNAGAYRAASAPAVILSRRTCITQTPLQPVSLSLASFLAGDAFSDPTVMLDSVGAPTTEQCADEFPTAIVSRPRSTSCDADARRMSASHRLLRTCIHSQRVRTTRDDEIVSRANQGSRPTVFATYQSSDGDRIEEVDAVGPPSLMQQSVVDEALEALLALRRAQLRDILLATAAAEPGLRYTQGMNSVARVLLEVAATAAASLSEPSELSRYVGGHGVESRDTGMHTNPVDEYVVVAFNLLRAALHLGRHDRASFYGSGGNASTVSAASPPKPLGNGLLSLFSHDMTTLRLRLYQTDRLLLRRFPSLHAHMTAEALGAGVFAAPWLLTLFANFTALDGEGVSRLWDRFVVGGWAEVLSVLLAVMAAVAPRLSGAPLEDMMRILHAPRAYYDTRPSQERQSLATDGGHDVDAPCILRVLSFASTDAIAVSPAELEELEADFLSLPPHEVP